jgi:predicted O-methyltransferase YrrM
LHNDIVSVYEGIVLVPAHEYRKIIGEHEHILNRLEEICIEAVGNEVVEGNCFCEHRNIRNRLEELVPKQMNLFSLGINASNILEIGFNAGHSALLFLLANKHSKLICFDICEHSYTIKCFEYLKTIFEDRIELIQGDSTVTIPEYRKKNPYAMFDVFHLDGSHDLRIANLDFENGYDVVKDVIIFDDTDDTGLNNILNGFIETGRVEEVKMRKTAKYEHRVVRKPANRRTS